MPPGGRGCAHTRPAHPLSPTGSMCYKRRAPGLPADSFGETACRAAFSSVFFYCRCRFSPRLPRTNWPMP
ncbi:putative FKBP-type 25 kDa peptidyl-prolyl cis-trans isomerase domain protein [Pseudomonas aeruginosa]|nr:putative FKBP-type 25 kDa peptidyl-prolyl cis-trans isomerase domain protein [Pseudomonas aeruginosa]